MNFNKQIKNLWSIPSYRIRLLFFVTLGTSAILGSLLIQSQYWQDMLSNFAVTFIAVGLIDFIWDILGGEPIEANMNNSFIEVNSKIDTINQSMSIISDLTNYQIGLERIWPTRRDWEKDPKDGLAVWKRRVCQAQQVDIVSSTFYTRWANDEDFWNELFEALKRGTRFRLLIYNPESNLLQLRSENEDDSKIGETSEMKMEIYSTLKKIARNQKVLEKDARKNFEVRLNSKYYQLAQIIHADKQILISAYLSKKTGSKSPTFQISGTDSVYFRTYAQQFDFLWEAGENVEDKDFEKTI
ncbi:MAG TPA: hypothetical protein PKE62_07205 [Anaerolineales bacterium]|nr:hypothetical protein [Anaerolineales bacterium]